MDDETQREPEMPEGEPIPMSASETPYERLEEPADLSARKFPEPVEIKDPDAIRPEDTQFTLRSFMILFTIACCVLAVGSRLRIDIFAGTLGILTLITAALMSLLDVRRAIIHLGWWILLGAYVLVCFAAVMQS